MKTALIHYWFYDMRGSLILLLKLKIQLLVMK